MNRNILEGQWKQMRGQIRQQWGRLTDDELDQVSGKYEQLAGLIQEKYGYSANEAESMLDDFLNDWGEGRLPGDTIVPGPRPKPKR